MPIVRGEDGIWGKRGRMSILIKGMDMPKSCNECRFSVDGWCYVCAPQSEEERKRITSNYCPLVEVVMCKDCKFLEMGQNESDSWRYCRMTKGNVADSDFCSYGERKINDIL